MSFALKKPGLPVPVCASTGADLVAAMVIAVSAPERRTSRFVNILHAPENFARFIDDCAYPALMYIKVVTSHVRFGSEADICAAISDVRSTPNSDRKSGHPQNTMSALPPKAEVCSA
jgi:hypothetical protein